MEEARDLFIAVDIDNSNSITYDEMIRECSKIHCAYVQSKIRTAIESDKTLKIEEMIKALDKSKNGELEITEFNELITLIYSKVEKVEVDELFKHFDKNGSGNISVEEFKKGLYEPINLENKLHFTLHDFMTPLKTIIAKFKLKPEGIFDHFSKNKSVLTLEDIQ